MQPTLSFTTAVGVAVTLWFILTICVENTEGGKTIKKHSAILRKKPAETYPVSTYDEVDTEPQLESPKKRQKSKYSGKSALVKDETPLDTEVTPGSENCSEGNQCYSQLGSNNIDSSIAVAQSQQQQRPALPLTMYELYWKNKEQQNSNSNTFLTSQSFLRLLERSTLDMARGILTGLGWELQSWELILLESIVKTVAKDMIFVFQLLF